MNISALNAYTREISAGATRTAQPTARAAARLERSAGAAPATASRQQLTPRSVLSPAEKQFFVRLFPQNNLQFESFATFDRQGRTLASGASVGSIFDGRV